MIAALLDLQKGAALALEAVDEMGGALGHIGRRSLALEIALRAQLRPIVEHAVDFRQRGIALGAMSAAHPSR